MDLIGILQILGEVLWSIAQMIFFTIIDSTLFFVPYSLRFKKDVSNDIVLITGGGSGFGRIYAQRFCKLGTSVVLWDINEGGLKETADLVKGVGRTVHTYKVDVSKSEEVYRVAAQVRQEVGDVTILINNAGVVAGKALLDTPDFLLHRTIDVNVKSVLWTYKAFAPSIIEKNHGHFVLMASMAGWFGCKGLVEYSTSKFANVGFEESIFYELGLQHSTGVHSTIINPFFSNTGMFKGVQTRFPSVFPLLEPEEMIDACMNAILTNQRFVFLPSLFRFNIFLKSFLSPRATAPLLDLFHAHNYMDRFVGRRKDK